MTTPDPDHQSDLLRFARDTYAQPGIQALCLHLQDEHDVDVVLLLMCCWHGCYHGMLSERQLAQAATFSQQWRTQLVQPLRQARRWLKVHPVAAMGVPDGIPGGEQEALRQRLKTLELDAEFMQLRALARLLCALPPSVECVTGSLPGWNSDQDPATCIRDNLKLYARDIISHGRQSGLDDQVIASLTTASLNTVSSTPAD